MKRFRLRLGVTMCAATVELLLAGCASYRIPTPYGMAKIDTFCKTVDIPRITVTASNNVVLNVEGYTSKGDTEMVTASAGALGAIMGAAVKASGK